MSKYGSTFLFKVEKNIVFFLACVGFSALVYLVTWMFRFKNPHYALYGGGAIGIVALANYFMFEFYITATGVFFCSHKTFFRRTYLPLNRVQGYKFDKQSSGSWVELRAEIYDTNRNLFSSFLIGAQDREFVEVMQYLKIPELGKPRKMELSELESVVPRRKY